VELDALPRLGSCLVSQIFVLALTSPCPALRSLLPRSCFCCSAKNYQFVSTFASQPVASKVASAGGGPPVPGAKPSRVTHPRAPPTEPRTGDPDPPAPHPRTHPRKQAEVAIATEEEVKVKKNRGWWEVHLGERGAVSPTSPWHGIGTRPFCKYMHE